MLAPENHFNISNADVRKYHIWKCSMVHYLAHDDEFNQVQGKNRQGSTEPCSLLNHSATIKERPIL